MSIYRRYGRRRGPRGFPSLHTGLHFIWQHRGRFRPREQDGVSPNTSCHTSQWNERLIGSERYGADDATFWTLENFPRASFSPLCLFITVVTSSRLSTSQAEHTAHSRKRTVTKGNCCCVASGPQAWVCCSKQSSHSFFIFKHHGFPCSNFHSS